MSDGTENGLRGFKPKPKKMGIREAAARVYVPKAAKAAKDYFLDTSKNYRNMPKTYGKKPE